MRLIDADALVENINEIYEGYMTDECGSVPYDFEIMVDEQPTVDKGYNQALEDLKFNLEEEKKMYAYNGHSLDTDKWLDDYLNSKLG